MTVETKESILFVVKTVILLIHRQKFVSIWKVRVRIKRLSEILNLVLQFRILLIRGSILWLLPLISLSSFTAAKDLSKRVDLAVFRLSGQVYYLSDIINKQKALSVLSCANSKLYLVEFLGVKPKDLMERNLKSLTNGREEEELFPYVLIEKLKLNSLSSGKETLSLSELHDLGKKCTKENWAQLNTDERALLLTEVYLRDRFKTRTSSFESLGEFRENLNKKEKHEFLEVSMSGDLQKLFLKKQSGKKEVKVDTSPLKSSPVSRPPVNSSKDENNKNP